MQFRRPEAAGHGASFSVVITAFEQIDFLGTAARRIGKRFDGVGDAQRHMRGAIVRIDAVAVGIVGGDEHEHRLAVEIPSEHRRVRTLHGKWHRVYGLADAAAHRARVARLELAFGGVLRNRLKFVFVPIHGTGGTGTVAVDEIGADLGECLHGFTGRFPACRHVDMLRRHRCFNVVNTTESFDQFRRFFFSDGNHVAGMALGILQSRERLDSAVTTASAISIGSPDSATATISATVATYDLPSFDVQEIT